ncbi:DUF4336 domain-containing protein [Luteimonas lutimaris]|uniref:DUF4336 domain-containing protein n=1 Tax=Luteimonas lutimaris TaxID=698645 RepID=A0ABP7MDR5_9GAMM
MAPSPTRDVPMPHKPAACYPPLNTPKPIAADAWIVDGPIIRFGMPWPKLPFPTRMTLLRLGDGNLFVHSPTPLTDGLREEIAALGTPRWIIGPNRIHYWWIPEWKTAFPDAGVWLAPRIREQAGARIDFEAHALDSESGYPWDGAISTLPVAGDFMTEVEFFHHPSRTLVLTDFIENFEAGKLGSWWMRWLTRLGGVQDPHGSMPRDMRRTFARQRPQLKAAVERMLAWEPDRIVLAHGRWYERDGAAELRRAFGWLLV